VAANVAALYWVNYSGRFKHLTFERSCQSVMSVRQSGRGINNTSNITHTKAKEESH